MTADQLLDEREPLQSKRPVFLTVLCILTWVGSAGLLVLSWLQYDSAVELKKSLGEMLKVLPNAGYPWTELETYYDRMILHALIQAAACLFCIIGALFAWRLRRLGFYLYALGELASLIAFGWMTLFMFTSRFGAVEKLAFALMTFFSLVFLVMYIVNLKHLRK